MDREKIEALIEKLEDLFWDSRAELKSGGERQYWQGQKDGLRKALVLLAKIVDDEPTRRHWETYQQSSLGLRLTRLELVTDLVNDAVYYIGEVLWALEGGNLHPLTVTNMKQWFWRYKQLAAAGHVPEANDTCYGEGS